MVQKNMQPDMKKRIVSLLLYALFWILFFFIARLFFILTHYSEASQYAAGEVAATFIHGLKLDISATGYVLLIPVLIMIPGLFFNGDWFGRLVKWYTYIIIIISSIIVVTDTLLYQYWGFRMDYTPLLYLNTPKDAAASVTFMQMAEVIGEILIMSFVFIIVCRKLFHKYFTGFARVRTLMLWIPVMMLLFASLIIPIRGGFGLAPINTGAVYFSENAFVNHTAINVVWNVGSSVINRKSTKNPYSFGKLEDSKAIVDSLLVKTGQSVKMINTTRPNILILVLESFGREFTGPLGGDTLTTSNFNRYCSEGILFTNFYSTGFRTDKAMPAILNGYPAQPTVSIMKDSKKNQSLPSLVRKLQGIGYNAAFWYGGNINFANFNGYLINSGFREIITEDDFDPEFRNSKWGIHDNVLFEALRDSMKTVREPFLKVVLSLSSHEPFEIPIDPVFEGSDEIAKFRNSVYYIDKVFGEFIDWAKGTGWWNNTLVVVVGDHYRRNSADIPLSSETIFQVPMLWLGGALTEKNIRITKYGSQTDIPLTLLHQMDLDDDYPFGKDMLSPVSRSFAFYTYNEGFGFITDSSKYIYDHKLGAPVITMGKGSSLAGRLGKAYLQVLFDDYLQR